MVARKSRGSIVNISSIAAAGALDCLVPYCASKGGMLLITKAMATELAPYNIRVNSVAPGTIDIARNRQTDPNYPGDWLPFIPMGRVGLPSDVAKPVIFPGFRRSRLCDGPDVLGGWRRDILCSDAAG
jgi:L-xylulose reductase